MKFILTLVPSMGRPAALDDCLSCLVSTSSGLSDFIVLTENHGGAIGAINAVPMELIGQYQIIGIVCDDVRMRTPNWDRLVCGKLQNANGLVYGRDGLSDQRLCTTPFLSASIPRALGFIYPPGLKHMCGDDFLMELLGPIGKLYYTPELFTEHLHHSTGRSPLDAVGRQAESNLGPDRATFDHYRRTKMTDDRRKIMYHVPL